MSQTLPSQIRGFTVERDVEAEVRSATAITALVVEDAIDSRLRDNITAIFVIKALVSKKQPALKDAISLPALGGEKDGEFISNEDEAVGTEFHVRKPVALYQPGLRLAPLRSAAEKP